MSDTAAREGSLLSKMVCLKNNKNDIVPEIAGDTTQLAAMVPTLFHDTAS